MISLAIGGCHSYRHVDVTVLDGTDDSPLEGVEVRPCNVNVMFMQFFPPKEESMWTDANGRARVEVCVDYELQSPGIIIIDDRYLMDAEDTSKIVLLPPDKSDSPGQGPLAMTIRLLTIEEFRNKYEVYGGFRWRLKAPHD